MNKETLKEFLSWMVDKGYINLTEANSLHLSVVYSTEIRTMRDAKMEFYKENRDKKLNDLGL